MALRHPFIGLPYPALRMVAVLLALALLARIGAARDWPQWCGTDGKNMASEEKGLPATFVPGEKDGHRIVVSTAKNVVWGIHTGAYGVSSPTVTGGKVLVGNCLNQKAVLYCLDEATGQIRWQWSDGPRPVPKLINGRRFVYDHWQTTLGLCSTATVDANRVYFVSQRCEVICLDLNGKPAQTASDNPVTTISLAEPVNTSRLLWKYDMYERLGVRPSNICNGSILVHGDFLYVPTSNGTDRVPDLSSRDELRQPPAPDAPSLIVLDKRTGRLLATDDARIARGPRLLHGQYSSPSMGRIGDQTLIFFSGGDGIMYAFEALDKIPAAPVKLKTAWTFDCIPPEYQAAHKKAGVALIKHYCLGDKRRADSTNKKSDGTWVGMSEIIATPVFHKNRIYVAIGRDPAHGRGRGALWCIDATQRGDITKTGKIWSYQGLDRTISNVSIADGLLYIADMAGRLHCLDAVTGKLYWVYETKAEVWGSTLAADGKVFMPTHKGLWVFAAGKKARMLGKIDLGAPIYVPPVAANGTLYIASRHYLWAVRQMMEQKQDK